MKQGSCAVLVAAALVGCKASAPDRAKCEADAAELQRFLSSSDTGPSPLKRHPRVAMPARPDLPPAPTHLAPVGAITRAGVELFGRELASEHALGVRLDELYQETQRRNRSRDLKEDPRPIYFQIDRDATWERVATALEAARRAHMDVAILAFDSGRPAPAPPPRSAIDVELDKLDESAADKAATLARLMKRVVEPCPQLGEVLFAVDGDGGDRAKRLIDGMAPALVACSCAADIPSIRSIMWTIVAYSANASALTVDLSPDGTRLELPASTPWSEASTHLKLATKSIHPVVR
jgi:hypothetical protein